MIWFTVVGVASNVMQDRPQRDEFVPILYVTMRQNPRTGAAVFVRTVGPATQAATQVRQAIEKADAGVLLEDYSTLQSRPRV